MRPFRRFLGGLLALLAMTQYVGAATTTLLQTGTWTQGHAPMYAVGGGSQPIVTDSGGAGGGLLGAGFSEGLFVATGNGNPPFAGTGTGPLGTNVCDYDGPITAAAGYHYLCLSPNAQGGALILGGSGGSASPLPMTISSGAGGTFSTAGPMALTSGGNIALTSSGNITISAPGTFTISANGATRSFPWMLGPNPSTVGALALWGDTIGSTLTSVVMSGDCTLATNGAITCLKSGGTSLGTMAFQNASGVAITGGTITGMPSPLNPADVATKAYADAIATGLKILPSAQLATTGALPNTPTYNNGTLGVGATLTANTNTTLSVDSTAATINTVVLVKNESTASHNGIYTVTQAGSGSVPWILTRATYFDIAAQMLFQSYVFITGGATLVNSSYTLAASVTTVGTDPLTWNLFNSGTNGLIGYGGTSTGSANAQVISPTNFGAADGQQVAFTAGFSNTGGAMTIDAGGGPLPVKEGSTAGPVNPAAGDITVNNRIFLLYQGGSFYLLNPTPNPVWPVANGGTGLTTIAAGSAQYAPGGQASFCANKGGTNQTISANTVTQVTFGSVPYNIGSHYSTGNSGWNPPAGTVMITAMVTYQTVSTNTGNQTFIAYIYKNGGPIAANVTPQYQNVFPTGAQIAVPVTIIDRTGGSDTYQVYGYENPVTPVINGSGIQTYFCGSLL